MKETIWTKATGIKDKLYKKMINQLNCQEQQIKLIKDIGNQKKKNQESIKYLNRRMNKEKEMRNRNLRNKEDDPYWEFGADL